jgi:Rrf2 family protein
MLQLTKVGEYALRALLYLASQPDGKLCLINDIAEAREVPRNYLSKIMQHLARAGFVNSRRGSKGGFLLARPADEITMRQVIEAVEGPIFLNVCLIRNGECHRDAPCPVHQVWKEAQRRFFEVLDSKTMAELAKDAVEIQNAARKASVRASGRPPDFF